MPRLLALACCIALAACGDNRTLPDDTDRRAYIAKVHQALHPSAAPLEPAEVDALVDRSDAEIVEALYADPRTRDAVFQLALSFLGAPVDQLHRDGAWAPLPFRYQPAVAAARAFRDGTDPLAELLTTRVALATGVVEPPRQAALDGLLGPQPPLVGTTAERRATASALLFADYARFRDQVAALPEPFSQDAMCELYFVGSPGFMIAVVPQILGVPNGVSTAGSPLEASEPDTFPLDDACYFGTPTTREEALAHLDAGRALIARLIARLEPLIVAWEARPESAFDRIDFAAVGYTSPARNRAFYPEFWRAAQNSSTNYDRRRGAYVLDRYFCDDLRPVGAALPEAHGQGKHASDPACAACHFKLDPMAGFFRRRGFRGSEYNGSTILFDDLATAPLAEYETAWRAPAGSGRELDVGYIRSTRDPALNSYGSSLDDLDRLVRDAPEVERCFTQRMFEFFNGADQAVDPGYLDAVAADVHASGGDRLARTAVDILTGETFRAADRNSTVCYDLAPGADAAHRPPCEVASILRAHCTSCHGGGNPQSGLDLSAWDRERGFRHVVDGAEVPRAETFARMRERITTSDLARQMPQAKDMPLRQREQLALWLDAQLD